jgi:hypothetical protein
VVEDAEGVGLGMPLYSSPPADATVGRATTPREYMEAFREIVVVVCCLFRAVTLQPAAVPAGQSTVKVLFRFVRVGSTTSYRIASHRARGEGCTKEGRTERSATHWVYPSSTGFVIST